MEDQAGALTTLLNDINGGRPGAFEALVEAVYADVRAIAGNRMLRQLDHDPDQLTTPATAIAHDALLEIRRQRSEWKNTEQFFAIAARLVSRLVLQYQRSRLADKRGGGNRGQPLDSSVRDPSPSSGTDAIASLEALSRLAEVKPRAAEIITLTFLCGKTVPQAAQLAEISVPQAERDRRWGLAWLKADIAEELENRMVDDGTAE